MPEALKQTQRCAVGRWAARGKAYLVMLRPVGDMLTMQQLHFAADVRPASEVEIPKQEVKPAELSLAQQLINQQTADKFDPNAYTDELRARIQAAIDKKVEGRQISVSDFAAEGGGKVIDLMEALRASLEKADAARASTAKLGPRMPPKRIEQPAKQARKAVKR
jgi:DNA end-binding protein Ku